MTRAADNPTTLQWFSLSALHRLGWGELRIRDALKRARPGHWRGYPQLEVSELDWANAATNIDCKADTADITRAGREPGDPMLWTERIEELALLLPADADGAPLSPEDAQAALALPVDISNAPTNLSKVPCSIEPAAEPNAEPELRDEPPPNTPEPSEPPPETEPDAVEVETELTPIELTPTEVTPIELTLRQQMIIAILRPHFPDRVPENVRPSRLLVLVKKGWPDECKRQGVDFPVPDRETIKRARDRM